MTSEDGYIEPRISVSIGRKISLPNYENVDIFMAVSGIEPGATTEEIEELLVTGDRAFELLKNRMGEKIRSLKASRSRSSDD